MPRGVIAKGQGGDSGEIKAIVVSGDVVAKVGAAMTASQALRTKGGKLVPDGTGTSSLFTCGFVRGVPTANGDYGLFVSSQTKKR